jgi:acetolactate synthase-1/2/3 large subunit
VDHAYCVPGESFLAVLDALYDVPEIDLIVARNECGAAMMADAYGKLTGRPGICLVSRGPGAANACGGMHIAFQDSTPLILLIGQNDRGTVDREGFQEVDYRRMYGQMAKWVAQVEDTRRISEYFSHAFHIAMSGRPGPVVLALPEDMLEERAEPVDPAPAHVVEAHPSPQDMQQLRTILADSRRPVLMLGGSGWDAGACNSIRLFAENNDLPVCVSFRAQDTFDNTHPNYIGDLGFGVNPKLVARLREADLLIVAGPRLGDITTGGYTLLDVPYPTQTLIHIHAGSEELGRVYRPALAINAGVKPFAAAAAALAPVRADWELSAAAGNRIYREWSEPGKIPGNLQYGEVIQWLRDTIPADSIISNGAGNYTSWVHRYYRYRQRGNQLAPTSGSMGYGTPAAVAAKRMYPERTVIAFAGDGCFLMNGQELATAVHYGINIIVIVVNNGMYGTIRMHQEREYPGRVSGSSLEGTDFAALARAYGAHGEVVYVTGEFAGAFERAVEANAPALIELRLDPEAITPSATLSGIREAAKS